MDQMKKIKVDIGFPFWKIRFEINTGPVTAEVVGKHKFAYDIWGDTVNTASRKESSGKEGRVNNSGDTYNLVKEFFECKSRGKVTAKGKRKVSMYFLNRIRPELSNDEEGRLPNDEFKRMYEELREGVKVT